tara:strand:+ start:3101 stop:3853 length:753 start_codon:yes stop_codon:yes gene_type:complete
MKKIFFLSLALFSIIMYGQNVVVIEYRHVSSEHIAEFEAKEMNHWSKVKQNGIDQGHMLASAFFRVADAGRIDDNTVPTHAFVHVYKDFEQLANSSKVWSNAEEILGMDQSIVSTEDISTTMRIQRYRLIDEILPLREFKYAVWNYAKPKDLNGFVNENLKLWKPYFQKKLGKNGLAGYGILARVYPQGMEQSSILTYDHYTDLASAMKALSPMDYDSSILSKSKMSEYDPDGFRYRVLVELLQLQGSVE